MRRPGLVSATLVDPMSVFSFALQKSASNIVLMHNHPSGDLIPSDKDKDVTDRMIQVGKILYTPVLDHLVISMRNYLSFLDAGIMEELEESTKWEPSYVTQERIRKQAEELGKKLGRLEGLRIGEKRGERKGKREGIEIGQKRGLEEGEEKGRELGKLEGLGGRREEGHRNRAEKRDGERPRSRTAPWRGYRAPRRIPEGRCRAQALGGRPLLILKSTGISEEELDSL